VGAAGAEEMAEVAAEQLPGECMGIEKRPLCTATRPRTALHHSRYHYTETPIHKLPEITEELAHLEQYVSKASTYSNWRAGTAREGPST